MRKSRVANVFFLIVIGALLSACACFQPCEAAPKLTPVEDAASKYIVAVGGKKSFGHACPISKTEALTAEHVSTITRFNGTQVIFPLIWSDTEGGHGTVMEFMSDSRRDLSYVRVDEGEFARFFTVAKSEPMVGSHVLIVGFDFKKGIIPRLVWARVLNITAGVLTYDDTPGPGSSGSCVLNEQGEVVAINIGQFNIDNYSKPVGLGHLITGEWAAFPKKYQERASDDKGEEPPSSEAPPAAPPK